MKIGIYGGSFNPPHLGHMAAAESAAKYLGLDELLLIPAGIPPHKMLSADAAVRATPRTRCASCMRSIPTTSCGF